jgi:tRNA(Ile)-lysidine synthase
MQRIAVGHNADDQVETVLMHWLRGAGPTGLRGMLPKTALSDYHLLGRANGARRTNHQIVELALIRPLLGVARAEIEAYCREQQLAPRTDRSNLDTTYFRNRLRHELLPLLEGYNARIRDVLWRSADVMAGDVEVLRLAYEAAWVRAVEVESEGAIIFGRAAWEQLPLGLQRGLLRGAIGRLRRGLRDVPYDVVERALEVAAQGQVGAQASLPAGLMLTVTYDRLIVAGPDVAGPPPDWPLLFAEMPLAVARPGITPVGDWQLEAEVLQPGRWERSAIESNPDPWRAYLDDEVVEQLGASGRYALALRRRQPGDRFRPLGLGGRTTRVGQLLINLKAPRAWRAAIPLLVAGETVLWVCGFRLAETARVTERTERVLFLRFSRA